MNLSAIEQIRKDAISEIEKASSLQEIENIRIKWLGRKGLLTSILRSIGELKEDKRRIVGKKANEIKGEILSLIKKKSGEIKPIIAKKQEIDVTLPGRKPWIGSIHPLTLTIERILNIFTGMGYSVEEGPEVETDWHNFEALNVPRYHPARDLHDTFYIQDNLLLRTHTTPVDIRVMEKQKPPLKVISAGRCYRVDKFDATHSPIFYQIDGFYVDKNVTFALLKGTLISFAESFFGKGIKTRFLPSYFPFTEPSAELHISCQMCNGKGCSVCKNTGFIEVLGCGMIRPEVFKNVGYDPKKYTGLAFGLGVERMAMLKYRINDIRLFYENDLRFLRQFR